MINQPDSDLKPESCDHTHDAQYCIKSTSLDGYNNFNFNLWNMDLLTKFK